MEENVPRKENRNGGLEMEMYPAMPLRYECRRNGIPPEWSEWSRVSKEENEDGEREIEKDNAMPTPVRGHVGGP